MRSAINEILRGDLARVGKKSDEIESNEDISK